MKKSLGRVLSWVLCLSLLWGIMAPTGALAARKTETPETPVLDGAQGAQTVQTSAVEPALAAPLAADAEYEIYPTPQQITYGAVGETVTLPATMQVSYGAGIDSYTKDRAAEAFQQAGVTLSESATTAVKLQVSIDANVAHADKSGAYTLSIGASGVTVVGVDTDAAFYGLTTVKRILQQVTGREVRCLEMEDYADVALRGFIEGYYGNPWTVTDRAALMDFGGELKMNIYFYAPKDDPKHSIRWFELYTEEELETLIRPLAEAGNRSKCYYGFALHPFWNMGSGNDPFDFSSDASYATDLARLKAKFEQVMDVGVRQIAILGDDVGMPSVGAQRSYIRLLNDLTDWVSSAEMQTRYPGLKTTIPFCPNDYMSNASSDQMQSLKVLPDNVPLIQTGGTIWGSVSHSYLSTYRTNMSGRGVFMWVNWPCTDKSPTSLIMGAHETVLRNDLTEEDINTLEGIMLNPMQQSEPSKAAIFLNADYAWNIWNGADSEERMADAWDDAFKYIDHDSAIETDESAALRELAKHMICNNGSSWRTDWHETIELADSLTSFTAKLTNGTLTDGEIDHMRAEFQKLYDAAALYRDKTTGNIHILGVRNADGSYPDQLEQMAPWLDFWVEYTQATLDLLDALKLMQNNADGTKDSQIVSKYLSAQTGLDAANSHTFYVLGAAYNALAGGEKLVPFTNKLLPVVADGVKGIIDPSMVVETIITNRADAPAGGLSAMRDGTTATEAVFKSPTTIAVGDYVGIKYNRAIALDSVRFEVGTAANSNDTFNNSKLQYMNEDGQWVDIPGATFSHTDLVLEATNLGLTAMGVRVIATSERTNTWLGIKEIYINGEQNNTGSGGGTGSGSGGELTGTIIKSSTWSVHQGEESNLTDGNDDTFVWYDPDGATGGNLNNDNSMVGDYIGLDLGEVQAIKRVRFVVGAGNADKWTGYKLQYSADGTTWEDVASYTSSATKDVVDETFTTPVQARYVRLVNTVQVAKWVKFSEITVWAAGHNAYAEIAYQSEVVKSITNPVGSLEDTSAALTADAVILQPGQFVGIALPGLREVSSIVAQYTTAPGVVLKAGPSEEQMAEVTPGTSDYGLIRYIRLENVGEQTASFRLTELSVQFASVVTDVSISYVGANGLSPETASDDPLLWFDGNISTRAKFATTQNIGRWVLFDLGQTTQIRSLRAYINNTDNDYPRNGVWELADSEDGPWTTVLTITTTLGEGQTDYNNPPSTNGSTDWIQDIANDFYQENTLTTPVSGRYLRYRVTSNSSNYLRFAEIVINGGEYVSTFEDPSYEAIPVEVGAAYTPDKMRDGDLTTGFRPNMTGATEGSVVYRVSDETNIGQINIMASANTSASLSIRTKAGWQTLGAVSGGLSQFTVPEEYGGVYEIKLSWGNNTPTFYELITVKRDLAQTGGEQAPSESERVAINNYTGEDTSILFTKNWKFNLGDAFGADAKVFNDSGWRTVDLPHDYSIEQDYTPTGEAESAYLPGGIGWYRKSFTVDPSWADKVVTIDFDGAYMDSEVYLNGVKLGENHYGYNPFSFVLPSDVLDCAGENVIAVKTNNPIPSSRWYSGSGIYRDVYLTVSEKVHVAQNGVTITTPDLEAEYKAGSGVNVHVAATVENGSDAAATVSVKNTVYSGNTAVSNATIAAKNVAPGASAEFTGTVAVSNPVLWAISEPNLYRMHTEVIVNGETVDTYDSEFGLRWFTIDVNTGFALNGEALKLKGVCMHHDQGGLGSEAWYRAMERQVETLVDMGVNAIRVTHNPYAGDFINICNRKGVLVIEELFDGWHVAKNSNTYDFSRYFDQVIESDNPLVGKTEGSTWAKFVIDSTISRDKNAPSVIAWSLGNEIKEGSGGADEGYTTRAATLMQWSRAMDSTRPLTFGDNKLKQDWAHAINISNQLAALDNVASGAIGGTRGGWVGMNYVTDEQLDDKHEDYPTWPIYASETASHVNSRGVYNIKGSTALNSNKLLTSYDKSAVSWGKVVSDAWYTTIINDYCAGEFVWTGFDYLGEPTPNNGTGPGWANGEDSPKSSYFGAIDTNGLPKDSFWLYRAMWNDQAHTLHILPTWDREDLIVDSNGRVEVAVYTDAPMVKLYLNDVEVGSATSTLHTTEAGFTYRTFNSGTGGFVTKAETSHETLYATFNVTYAEGTLRAVACDASGSPLNWITQGRSEVRSTTGASELRLTADRETIKNDGRDLSYITIDVVDATGEIVNGATPEITVTVSGEGVLMALDNGVQPDHTSFLASYRKAGAGQLVAIVQSTEKAGSFTVTAKSDGLIQGTVTVNTAGVANTADANTPVSYELAKLYYVQLNTEPELPSAVEVTMGDGSTAEKSVSWNNYDVSKLGTVGNEFAITGVIEDCGVPVPVSVGVVVVDNIVALLSYSTAIRVGETPNLPASRPAVMADGTVLSAQFPVTWDTLGADYSKEGVVAVPGRAVVFGEELKLTAWVRVDHETIIEGQDVMNAAIANEPTTTAQLDKLRDGNTATTVSLGAGESISTRYDTAQNFYKIQVTYAGTPASGVTVSAAPNAVDWVDMAVEETVDGNTVTYSFGAIRSMEQMKLTFAQGAEIAEVKFINATSDFTTNNTATLDDIKLSGVSALESALAERVVTTPAALATVEPVSERNAAYTILPEDANGQILIVTESEDHSTRDQYTVVLGQADMSAENDSMDYPYQKTTASAPSQQNSGNDGPATNAADGDLATFWHSRYNETNSASTGHTGAISNRDTHHENYIQLTLEEATKLVALRYYPRDNMANGRLKNYEVMVSTDETNWQSVASGVFTNTAVWQLAEFSEAVTAKYVRLYATSSYGNSASANIDMAVGELRVVMALGSTDLSPATVTVEPEVLDATGAALTPGAVTVSLFGETLTAGTDYTLSYGHNVEPGTAYVYVTGKGDYYGTASGTFRIREVAVRITGFEPVQVNALAGETPVLPATVTATMSAGESQTLAVTWDALPTSPSGTYTVQGTVEGTDKRPTAVVTVVNPVSVDKVSTVTEVGKQPALPSTVTVQFDNGTSRSYPVTWGTVNVSAAGTVEVTGTIAGLSITATASVRVAEATGSTKLLSQLDPTDTNVNHFASASIFPFAMAWYSSGNNNPYVLIDGTVSANWNIGWAASGEGAYPDRWSDWQSGSTVHDTIWAGVAFATSTEGVTRAASQAVTLEKRKANRAVVRFIDESARTAENNLSAVTYPASYDIQYYTGTLELTFDTRITDGNDMTGGNGRVKDWTNSPLLDDANWTTVTYTGTKPAIVLNSTTDLTVSFETVETAIIRVKATHRDGTKWVGMTKLEVYGPEVTAHSDFTASISIGGTNVTSQFTGSGNSLSMTRTLTTGSVPRVTATATNNAQVSIKQAANGSDTAVVTITSEDGSTTKTYTIQFSQQNATFTVTKQGTGFTVTPTSGAAGTTVTLTPDSGKEFASLIVYTATGPVATTAGTGGSYTFTMPAANVTVEGATAAASYTITYDLNGGVVTGGTNPTEYTSETGAITLTNPVRTDYTFTGWTGTDLAGATMNVTIPAGATGERVYTANWTANVAHDVALPKGLSANLTSAKAGRTITLSTAKGYEVTGITVTGPDGAIAVTDGSFTMPNGDVTVTATASPITYTITYDLDGGTLTTANPASYTVETASFTLKNPTKDEFIFSGWTGTGVATASTRVSVNRGSTGNRTYTATWREKINSDFEVTYIRINGEDKKDDFNANRVLNMTIGANDPLPVVTAAATNRASVTIQQASEAPGTATVTITSEDGSLTQTYTIRITRAAPEVYSVTLPSGGKITATPAQGTAGTEITLAVPTGYEMTDLTVTAGGASVPVTGNKFIMPEGNVTVSATVRAITYTIRYNLDGGVLDGANKTSYTVEDESFTLGTPTKEGYVFTGWTGTGLTGAQTSVTVTKGSTGNRTYTATWRSQGGGTVVVPDPGPGTEIGGDVGGGATLPPNTVVDEAGNKITTNENSKGETTVTTVAPDGATTTVTTAPTGEQSAQVTLPANAAGTVELAMPELKAGESSETAPEVKVTNKSGNPVNVVIPIEGGETVVAIRVEPDGTETVVPMSLVDENGLRVRIEDDATLKIVDNKKEFIDVPDSFWGAEAVDFVASRELFNGVADNIFAPNQTMNRAMLVTVLWRLEETPESSIENTFADVKNGAYYEDAVRWGTENKVVEGTDQGFEPDGAVTREMMAVLLYRMAGSPAVIDELPRRFTDGDKVSSWAQIAMIWAVQNDIIQGRDDGTLDAKATATRAEAAAMLRRFVKKTV